MTRFAASRSGDAQLSRRAFTDQPSPARLASGRSTDRAPLARKAVLPAAASLGEGQLVLHFVRPAGALGPASMLQSELVKLLAARRGIPPRDASLA